MIYSTGSMQKNIQQAISHFVTLNEMTLICSNPVRHNMNAARDYNNMHNFSHACHNNNNNNNNNLEQFAPMRIVKYTV